MAAILGVSIAGESIEADIRCGARAACIIEEYAAVCGFNLGGDKNVEGGGGVSVEVEDE